MKRKNLFTLLLIIMLISSTDLFSQDWPQFMGGGRNGKAVGFKAPASWPSELPQQWKMVVGTGDASPVLSGNKLFVHTRQGTDEIVRCLDAKTGKEIWKYSYNAPVVTGPPASHPGPRSTPVVVDGKLYTLGVGGTFSCFDVKTGKLLWSKEDELFAATQFNASMSPLAADGMIIIQQGGKEKGVVVAYELNTGNEKWKFSGEGPAYGSPAILTLDKKKQLVLVTEESLVALDLSVGKLLWQYPAVTAQRYFNAPSPYIDGQIIYFTGDGTGTRAIQVVKEGNNFVTKELWKNNEIGNKFNTPVLKDRFLYGFSDKRRMYCLDASTGKPAWYDSVVNSDFASIVDCGSVLLALPSTGNLIVVKPDSKAYAEIVKYKVADTPVFAFPVITRNAIYIKDAENLIMYIIQ